MPTVAPRRHRLRVEFSLSNQRTVAPFPGWACTRTPIGHSVIAHRAQQRRTPLGPAVVPEVTTDFAGDITMTPGPSDVIDRSPQDALLSHGELWLRYFALGGARSALELDAFLYGALEPNPRDHGVIAHA